MLIAEFGLKDRTKKIKYNGLVNAMAEKDLSEILASRSEGRDLLYDITAIKEAAIPLLNRICINFPEYTSHDINHSEIVLTRINQLIPDNLKQELNSFEIYFLMVSAYLHDLGMADLDNLIIPEEISDNRAELIKYIREDHHVRSESYIIENYRKLNISDINQARIIGKICRGHRKDSLDDRTLFDPKQVYKNKTINIPFLASILRASDELDLTFERIPMIVYDMGLIRNTISKLEWEKHLSVDGVSIDPENESIFRCTATCKSPEIHRLLKNIEAKINNQLEDLHVNLYHYHKYSKDIPWKFILKINAEGYSYYDLKFSLKENEILTLLIGEGLYERKEECIRELLKNCVDACRLNSIRIKKETGSSLTYLPEIIFELDSINNKLIVTDNGVGMDGYIIDNYFSKIGNSFYNSSDFIKESSEFSPVSELGIGFLSCFMIADKIEIETKTLESDSLIIEVDSISNYFFVKPGLKKYPGTTVTLYLKENTRDIKLIEELEYYARHLEIPVRVKSSEYIEYLIENRLNQPFFKIGNLEGGNIMISEKISNENFDVIIGILCYKLGDHMIPIEYYRNKNIYYNKPNLGGEAIISYNGVFVCNHPLIPMWLAEGIVFLDINIKKNILNLNVGRNRLIYNDKFVNFYNLLEDSIIKYLNSLLNTVENGSAGTSGRFVHNIIDLPSSKIIKNPIMQERYVELESGNKELLNLIIKFYLFRCFSEEGIEFLRYDIIMKKEKEIKILNYRGDDDNFVQDMLFSYSNKNDKYIYI